MPRKKQKPKPKSKNGMKNFLFLIVCLLVGGGFGAFISTQARSYNALRADYNYIQSHIANEEAIAEELAYQLAHFDSDAMIATIAREQFGWIRPDEIVFRVREE